MYVLATKRKRKKINGIEIMSYVTVWPTYSLIIFQLHAIMEDGRCSISGHTEPISISHRAGLHWTIK